MKTDKEIIVSAAAKIANRQQTFSCLAITSGYHEFYENQRRHELVKKYKKFYKFNTRVQSYGIGGERNYLSDKNRELRIMLLLMFAETL
jgi:hypothetical protein